VRARRAASDASNEPNIVVVVFVEQNIFVYAATHAPTPLNAISEENLPIEIDARTLVVASILLCRQRLKRSPP
jgi:hypothetical protein